uniref:Uncharacterized protein n=1 Tax=Pithovirus LCPAC101 TaxID=2506586 RepID=A0A481Z2R8_9VIRU|nr:MAG: uncharacterized protein LCPAC101_02910 [Pithovirus LCPAC101]
MLSSAHVSPEGERQYLFNTQYCSVGYNDKNIRNDSISDEEYEENNKIMITRDDLIYISQYNPSIDYNEYVKIMKYSRKKILSIFPELSFIKNIDIVDMKYYVLASYGLDGFEIASNLNKYSYYLERGVLYYNLGEIAKTLILSIYGDVGTYMKCAAPSPLEDLVIGIDENIDNIRILLSLADKYGLSLTNANVIPNENYRESIRDHIYFILDDIIQTLYCRDDKFDTENININININYNPNIILKMSDDVIESYTLKHIINMTYLDYINVFPNTLIDSYSERLSKAVLDY